MIEKAPVDMPEPSDVPHAYLRIGLLPSGREILGWLRRIVRR